MAYPIRQSALLLLFLAASSQAFVSNTQHSCSGFTSQFVPSSKGKVNILKNKNVQKSSSSMTMHTPMVPVAAVGGLIAGGAFAGGLHAIAGPDHLAALLPRTVGQRWYRAGRTGALWGIGHGISVTLLGTLGFLLKSKISMTSGFGKVLHGASHCLEAAVGISLVVIGLLGMKEAKEWETELEESGSLNSLSAAAAPEDHVMPFGRNRSIVFNGLLHGFSWDGAPSLAPALAVASWRGNLAFLLSYGLGTMVTMALTTTLVGEGTRRAGQIFHRPDLPQKLSFFSSILAMLVGIVWTGLAFI